MFSGGHCMVIGDQWVVSGGQCVVNELSMMVSESFVGGERVVSGWSARWWGALFECKYYYYHPKIFSEGIVFGCVWFYVCVRSIFRTA